MGVFSEMDIDRKAAQNEADTETDEEMDLRSQVEAFEDARQEAEAAEAQATLAAISKNDVQEKDTETEEQKRKAHEEAEAKRKAEWEAKKQAKEEEIFFAWENALATDDDSLMLKAMEHIRDDYERVTGNNIKQCIAEMLQMSCREDIELAKQVHHPCKNMIACYRYVDRKALEYLKQELKAQGITPKNGVYGTAITEGICYQWAKDYFFDMDAPEDKDPDEEKFVPKPYIEKPTVSKTTKKKPEKKTAPKKIDLPTPASTSVGDQIDMFSMIGEVA